MGYCKLTIVVLLMWSATAAPAADFGITWFSPFYFSPPLANHSKVILYGKTLPSVTVSIDKTLVLSENPALMESFAELQKSDVLQSTSDANGNFELSMTLPQGLVQVPVAFMRDENNKTYVISLQVEKEKVAISVPTAPDDRFTAEARRKIKLFVQRKYGLGRPLATALKGFWLSAGVGANYQIISQSLNSDTSLKFSSMDFPSANVRAAVARTKWLANVSYLYQTGKVSQVSAPFTIRDSSYTWSSFLLEAGYNWRNEYFGERSRFTWLLGLQQHQLPSFRVYYGNEIRNQTLNLTSLSLGPMFTLEMGKSFLLEVFMHYQHGLASSTSGQGDARATPKLVFDGSVGTMYRMSKNSYLGAFWFGQWNRSKLKFRNEIDQVEVTGEQNLFYSGLDLRFIRRF